MKEASPLENEGLEDIPGSGASGNFKFLNLLKVEQQQDSNDFLKIEKWKVGLR